MTGAGLAGRDFADLGIGLAALLVGMAPAVHHGMTNSNMSTVIRIQVRNNADARRMGAGQIRIPGASSCKHNGGKTVIVVTDAVDTTSAWLDDAHEVASYEVQS